MNQNQNQTYTYSEWNEDEEFKAEDDQAAIAWAEKQADRLELDDFGPEATPMLWAFSVGKPDPDDPEEILVFHEDVIVITYPEPECEEDEHAWSIPDNNPRQRYSLDYADGSPGPDGYAHWETCEHCGLQRLDFWSYGTGVPMATVEYKSALEPPCRQEEHDWDGLDGDCSLCLLSRESFPLPNGEEAYHYTLPEEPECREGSEHDWEYRDRGWMGSYEECGVCGVKREEVKEGSFLEGGALYGRPDEPECKEDEHDWKGLGFFKDKCTHCNIIRENRFDAKGWFQYTENEENE